jgi:hypothetical protein
MIGVTVAILSLGIKMPKRKVTTLELGISTIVRNVGNKLPIDAAQHLRRQIFSNSFLIPE